jgi:hypothetical protein
MADEKKEYKFGEPERPEQEPETKYEEASQEIVDLAKELIDDHHPHLRQARILYLVYEDKLDYRGLRVPGRVYKVHDREKEKLKKDFEVVISQPVWNQIIEEENEEAAMDWLLCFITVGNEAGTWTTQDPDFYGFYNNVSRYGTWHTPLKNLDKRLAQQKLPFQPETTETYESTTDPDLTEAETVNY